MNHKTLISIIIALSAILLPLGGWTLMNTSANIARILVLEEFKSDTKDSLKSIDGKLDQVLEEQRQVRADLRRRQVLSVPPIASDPAPTREKRPQAP